MAHQGQPVLSGLNCHFRPGRTTAIVGPAGSGKSLLLSAIAGGLPTGGAILVEGQEAAQNGRATLDRMTVVPPRAPLIGQLTVLEHVRFLVSVSTGRITSAAHAITALRTAEIPDRTFGKRASLLTPLERLCVWLASHRLRSAPILVADDPAADFGPGDMKVAVRLLREAGTAGSCVVISTRSSELAAAAADDVLTIVNGHLELR